MIFDRCSRNIIFRIIFIASIISSVIISRELNAELRSRIRVFFTILLSTILIRSLISCMYLYFRSNIGDKFRIFFNFYIKRNYIFLLCFILFNDIFKNKYTNLDDVIVDQKYLNQEIHLSGQIVDIKYYKEFVNIVIQAKNLGNSSIKVFLKLRSLNFLSFVISASCAVASINSA